MKSSNRVPLKYPTTIENYSEIKNVLLISDKISESQQFVDSVNVNTFPIVYSIGSSSDELKSLLKEKFTSIDRIGFAFHSSLGNPKMFLDRKPLFLAEEKTPFSENMTWLLETISDFHVKNVDFLACNTLNYPAWVNYYELLNKESGVIVGASDDKTGNLKYGGDWIMESTGQDVEAVYFTAIIEYYKYVLDPVQIGDLLYLIDSPSSGKATVTGYTGYDNVSLTNVTIPSTISYSANTYTVVSIDTQAFASSTILVSVTIPSSVTTINAEAFYGCISLVSMTIPNSVTTIDAGAFYFCYSLTSVYFDTMSNSNLPSLGIDCFYQGINPATNTAYYYDGVFRSDGTTLADLAYFQSVGFADAQVRPPPICFLEGSKILCLIDQKETYLPIETIRKGTLVKTRFNGYKAVDMIGHSKIYNPGNKLHSKNRLYKLTPQKYPELTEDLIVTGCHSILVGELTNEQREKSKEFTGDIYITEDRYRLIACLDPKAEPYEKEGIHPIWHLALDNQDNYMNYGCYANGLLVETTSKRMMSELSGMELV
jgi:hypothetical protein